MSCADPTEAEAKYRVDRNTWGWRTRGANWCAVFAPSSQERKPQRKRRKRCRCSRCPALCAASHTRIYVCSSHIHISCLSFIVSCWYEYVVRARVRPTPCRCVPLHAPQRRCLRPLRGYSSLLYEYLYTAARASPRRVALHESLSIQYMHATIVWLCIPHALCACTCNTSETGASRRCVGPRGVMIHDDTSIVTSIYVFSILELRRGWLSRSQHTGTTSRE